MHTVAHYIVTLMHTVAHYIVTLMHTVTHYIVKLMHTVTHYIVKQAPANWGQLWPLTVCVLGPQYHHMSPKLLVIWTLVGSNHWT